MTDDLRRVVRDLDPHLPIYWVRTLEEWIDQGRFNIRLMATLFSVFGVVALILAAAGLYSVLAYEVEQRAFEIEVRRALGASGRTIVELLASRGSAQLAWGVGVGLVAAALFARLLANSLYRVETYDPLTFIVVAAVIGSVVILAALIPARRALKVDPADALRAE